MNKEIEKFTNNYSVTKTLRFELEPCVEITKEEKDKLFAENGTHDKNCDTYTEYNLKKASEEYYHNEKTQKRDLQLKDFLHDQDIEDMYQSLKPVFDKIHEEFITESLESAQSKKIFFKNYYFLYEKQKNEKNKEEKKKIYKKIEKEEEEIRKIFGSIYETTAEKLKQKAGKNKKNKYILSKSSFNVLTEKGILEYIRNNIDNFTNKNLKNKKGAVITKQDIEHAIGSGKNEGVFSEFFTYFTGFNDNRKNYYSIDKKTTSVAYRIIDENLPKFCDNVLAWNKNKKEYLKISDFLKTKKLKNSQFNKKHEPELSSDYNINDDEKIFSISYFVNCLSQSEIEKYNLKVAKANYLINLYNQNKNDIKLSMFKKLYKQIGCGKNKEFIKTIKNNDELKKILQEARDNGNKYFIDKQNEKGETAIEEYFKFLSTTDFKDIYWSDKAINTISNKYFTNWYSLANRLGDEKIFNKNTKKDKKDIKYKIPKAVMLSEFFNVLDNIGNEDWQKQDVFFKKHLFEDEAKSQIIKNAKKPSLALLQMIQKDAEKLVANFIKEGKCVLTIPTKDYQKDENKQKIKNWLDNARFVEQILKYWKVMAKFSVDNNFLNIWEKVKIEEVVQYYDVVRNYLTQKPQETINKLKLNFGNASTAKGWDLNRETANSCAILKDKEENKYLATMKHGNTTIFEKNKNPKLFEKDKFGWLKMSYKYFPGASKMIPKCSTQLNQVKKHFKTNSSEYIIPKGYKVSSGERFIADLKITKEVWELNNRIYNPANIKQSVIKLSEKKTGEKQSKWIKAFQKKMLEIDKNLYKKSLVIWINFCKDFLTKYPEVSMYNYNFKNASEYDSVDEFYYDVDSAAYKLNFQDNIFDENKYPKMNFINKLELEKYVKEGKIYLFKIKNRDNNLINGRKKNSAMNLQTIYWNTVFEEIPNNPKLNGEAEIFYRPALPLNKMKKASKKDNNGNEVEIKLKNGQTALQNFRFFKEKFIFHCPITLNFSLKGEDLTRKINGDLIESKNKKDIYILGIDRGEKNLAYYSLVNQEGKILEQGSFNIIRDNNSGKEKNYLELLENRSRSRASARKNWTTINTIKELKNGYISQVVHKIVDLAIYKNIESKEPREKPVIIVLEDLNRGFKRSRQKIEQQIYQKLELALAKKLNFIVDKRAKEGEVGSTTMAIQLTPLVKNFADIENRKQFGNMIYVRANYTSQTDPVTGWRKSIYLKKGSEEYIKNQILGNKEKKIKGAFDDIGFDGKDYYFSYTDQNTNKKWTLYSSKKGVTLDRYHRELIYENSDKKWIPKKQNIFEMLNGLFHNNFDKKVSLLEQLKNGTKLNKINEHNTVWESLRFVIHLIQQIRNTGTEKRDEDFILSPVRNEKTGYHFDSRQEADKKEKTNLPVSGDANGAYNIARKGIMVVEHIQKSKNIDIKDSELYISDHDWDNWLAKF